MTTQDPQNTQPAAPPVPPVPPVAPAQQPYAATNPAAAPVYYAPARPTNTLAIVAFVLAFFVALAGVICGHIALGQIKRTGEGGHGLALAAVILGYVFIGLGLIFGIVYAIFIIALVSSAGYANSFG